MKRQIGHCESALSAEEISGEEGEGKSWHFMGERFIWNTQRGEGGETVKTKEAYAELSMAFKT